MTTNAPTEIKDIRTSRNNSIWVGILLTVLGILAIALPITSTIVVESWISLILISAGGAKLVYAFQTREQGGFVWKLLLAILYVATGIMLFANPLTGVLTITLLLGSFLLTEGVFELILALRLRPQQNWTWILGNALITLLLGGFILFQYPFNAPWLIGTLVGASVLMSGVSRLMLSLGLRSSSNQPTVNPS